MDEEIRQALTQIFSAAVAAVDPYNCVRENLSIGPGMLVAGGIEYPLTDINNIYVIGAGKAAYGMAAAAEIALGELITDGVVVTKDGHGGPLVRLDVEYASHPVPDARGEAAARRLIEIAAGAGKDDLVICLLSGGASALLPLPAEGITLADKQEVTRLLLACGADIGEVNTVRKHLSAIKGGQLARAACPASLISLIISDVVGDDLSVIASGPTSPDETTYLQAADILKMRGVYAKLPDSVRERLDNGMAGGLMETPGPDDPVFADTRNIIIASNATAIGKAAEVAGYMGYTVRVLDSPLTGEAGEAAVWLHGAAGSYLASSDGLPACILAGGETTVTIKGDGLGGRNQELALAFAINIDGDEHMSALFAGTDGGDGPTDAAGAFVDGETVKMAAKSGIDAASYLSRNDSYHFFERAGGHFKPGPTGTNVMDIAVIIAR
jgi:glycerate 2-kinase